MNMKRTYEGHVEKAICRPRRESQNKICQQFDLKTSGLQNYKE